MIERISYFFVTLIAGIGMIWMSEQGRANSPAPIPVTIPTNSATTARAIIAPDNLQLVIGGMPQPFNFQNEIPIAGDLQAKLEIQPGDERYTRTAELFLYQATAQQPIDSTRILVTGRMRYMDHGTFRQVAERLGDGHYAINLPFAMPGEWELDFDIGAMEKQRTLTVFIDLFQ
ncbi:MAG: hypothetical protein HY070_03450 [Chloroflexi bacterium]|nr:hypothetical protein [Chloroflexota bacterium]